MTGVGVEYRTFPGSLLFDPDDVRTHQGNPFQVFTPFWRSCLALPEPERTLRTPRRLSPPDRWPNSVELSDL
ncbi:deoxyribodipyrimidine photo-lyase, partial [Enterococcus casseliflavus]|uniref:deoxyribodipyrimidine photo-lyase n=1 Tax=Enterococcus casseliflavus TaxID=37734 RepID=UPI003D0D4DBE